jgi:cephalosporin-C deacetylase-like acetyl esterase
MTRYLDSLEFTDRLRENLKPELPFTAKNLDEAEAWQGTLRKRIIQLLGGFPAERCQLEPEVPEVHKFDGYTRETVYFNSRDRMTVKGYFLLPRNWKSPGPCVVCLPGHGRGVDDIVGIQEDGTQRTEYGEYQNDFALQCLDHGMAVFAIEQFGFGARRDERARKAGAGDSSCNPAAGAALLLGETMIGWRVWDTMRAIDYLLTRPEVDPKRIGAMGISGGGTTTLWAAAIDERIRAAMVSGYFCPVGGCIAIMHHCIDNYVPGILKLCDHPDLAGLVAPRALFVESGTEDGIFLIDGVKEAVHHAENIYKVFGHPERFDREYFKGEHQFHGAAGLPFMARQLGV